MDHPPAGAAGASPYPAVERFLKLKGSGAHVYSRTLERRGVTRVQRGGRPLVTFASNSYLGLKDDPYLVQRAHEALDAYGILAPGAPEGAPAADLARALEEAYARHYEREAAVFYSSGFVANLMAIRACLGSRALALVDAGAHASVHDGIRASGSHALPFRHRDFDDLERKLKRAPAGRERWVLTNSVQSMAGTRYPLADLVALKRRHGFRLYVDDAHGFGVFGDGGRGVPEADGVLGDVDGYFATFSKAMGVFGGAAAFSSEIAARAHAVARDAGLEAQMPAFAVATAHAAFDVVRTQPHRRARLWANAGAVRAMIDELGLPVAGGGPIFAVMIGDDVKAGRLCQKLEKEHGLFVSAAIHPAVPPGEARLRLTVNAEHGDDDIRRLREGLSAVREEILS